MLENGWIALLNPYIEESWGSGEVEGSRCWSQKEITVGELG